MNQQQNIRSNYKNSSREFEEFIFSLGKSTLYIILIAILIYVIYYTYIYYTTPCNKVIPYFTYLTNFGQPAFCDATSLQTHPIQNQVKNTILELSEDIDELGKNNSQNNDLEKQSHSDEVFLISNQLYNWDEAKCKCESYGARLASKAELTEAYNKGAHWCNYGWIDGSEAYYPVQQCELDRKVQNIRNYYDILRKHYQDPQKYTFQMVNEARNKMEREQSLEFCGKMAGLNGGKFASHVKFGATCYGKKPKGMSVREKEAKCDKPKKSLLEEEEEKAAAKQKGKKCDGISSSDQIQAFSPDQWYA
jgi:hypothetical protein